jgi:transcriptional regulator with XRE-family HTH domain
MTIGEKLTELRGARTREQVARDTGLSLSAIAMYELDQRVPRDRIKIILAKYYGQTVGSIFFEDEVTISDGDAS